MRELLRITDPGSMEALLPHIHDMWFDVESLRLDEKAQQVDFELARKSRDLACGKIASVLRIRHALGLAVRDTEQVGEYDIYEARFDSAAKVVTIEGNIPILIEIQVGDCELLVLEPDGVVRD